ncbi:MAG: amino acid permease [Gammaproteobacteria bacterium]|nr:amino acid permease [Gammaproteobacteria bacterium]
MTAPAGRTALKRTLSLPQMVLYGLGTTIGAGIYALIGELGGLSGYFSPLAFLLAALMAGSTALSFAELCSRFPRAAGASLYVREGLRAERLSTIVGLLVAAAGIVSAAALVNGFVGHLHDFVAADRTITIALITLAMGGLAAWGIAESVTIAVLVTVVEIGGLLLVIFVSRGALAELPARWPELSPGLDPANWRAVLSGALLAFYAFIGFEDMVDVAEEVRDVRRTLPLAILATLAITTMLYVVLVVAAVLTMPPPELAASGAPLAAVYALHTGRPGTLIGIIGMFAILNGALIQLIMASRVLYGLASRGQLPAVVGVVSGRTQTPLLATGLVTAAILALALAGRLAALAELTSALMLTVFALVNLALVAIKRRGVVTAGQFTVPAWVPAGGFLVSAAFVMLELAGHAGL